MAGYAEVGGDLGGMPYALIPALIQMISQGFQTMPVLEQKALPMTDAAQDELRNWQQVALKEVAKGRKPEERAFVTEHLPAEVAETVRTGLEGAEDEAQVRAVFGPWLRRGAVDVWESYP
jgi:hypothetical protein